MISAVERLVRALRVLPGVGRKTAARYTYALLAAPSDRVDDIVAALQALRNDVRRCGTCGDWTESDPCELCTRRGGAETICVVEHPADVAALEKTGRYRGLYHVLHGVLDPLAGVSIEDLAIDALIERVRGGAAAELLLALSPTREGEATCRLIATLLADQPQVRITRLAYGLPLGTQLEYLDEGTLGLALDHRRAFLEPPEPRRG